MDTDWKDWNVVRMVESPPVPEFLLGEWETVEERIEQEKGVLTEHWNQFQTLLENDESTSLKGYGGYATLCRLSERLGSRLEKIEERRDSSRRRSVIFWLTYGACETKARDIASKTATSSRVPNSADEDRSDTTAVDAVLDEPIGNAWPIQEVELPLEKEGWKVNRKPRCKGNAEGRPTLSDIQVRYFPEDDNLEEEGVDPDSVSSSAFRFFGGDVTWREVLDRLERLLEHHTSRYQRYSRTGEVIRFRRGVLENVLHQYEAYGSVEEMTREGAGEIIQESTRGRPSRLENPEEVLKTLDTVCEWLDTEPPKTFRGERGLVDFAAGKFELLSKDGVRDRIRFTFQQLAREYPDLPTPEFSTGTNGAEYVESEPTIRSLRDEYESRFVEK